MSQYETYWKEKQSLNMNTKNFNGRKIDDSLESPITVNTYLKMSDGLIHKFHEIGLVPNHVTYIRIFFGLLSIYLVWIECPKLAGAAFLFSYLFDCCDGMLAREYNQVTEFGSKLEHTFDFIITVGIIIVIMLKFPMSGLWIGLLVASTLGCLVHMGLVDQYNENCAFQTPCDDISIRVCRYVAKLFEPNEHPEESWNSNQSNDICMETERKFCANLFRQMQWTKWLTDVNIILVIGVYLLTSC
jgi:hypothetical protein